MVCGYTTHTPYQSMNKPREEGTLEMNSVILCNTTVQVMGTVSWQKAITMIFAGKAHSIKDSDVIISSQHESIAVPEIIMLTNYVPEGHLYRVIDGDNMSRHAIKNRDNHKCAYCGKKGTTIDHIIPQSRGGTSKWDNVITCCHDCNSKKSDKLLSELGWELLFEPTPITTFSKMRHYQKTVDQAIGVPALV